MSPSLPLRSLLGTDTSADHQHHPAPGEAADLLQRHCQDGSDGCLCSGPSRKVGGQDCLLPALLLFPSHPFPSSLPSCVPHFLAFCAAWESSRIFSAVAQPTSEGKGWMTKPSPSSKPTVSRRAAGSWATPLPHPSSLLPPSAPSKPLHTAEACRMLWVNSSGRPTGGFCLGRGQRGRDASGNSPGEEEPVGSGDAGGQSPPVRAQHCLTARFCLPWRRHRAGPLLPPAGLAGGRPAPRLPPRGVTLAAFISETEEKHGQGAVEKQATGSRCLRVWCSERSIPSSSGAGAA